MAEKKSKYAELGVDAGKTSVRKIFGKYVVNHFPQAFVNIVIDPFDPDIVFTQHMDGDGSKFVQRLLVYLETGDIGVIGGAVDDAFEMNMGDIAASGFVGGTITVTDVINIKNIEKLVPKDLILEQVAIRFEELINLYRQFGFNIVFLGGETADLPDQVRSVVFDVALHARTKKSDIITGETFPGDKIWGFASDGQAKWEQGKNSGIMSNGLTLARTSLMWEGYTEKYPFLVREGGQYQGKYLVGEMSDHLDMPVSDAVMSPTRLWSIVIKIIIDKLRSRKALYLLHGVSMNTGGGATKIGHVGKGIVYKKKMPNPPGIFQLIHRESGEKWKDMFKGFNCGVGIDLVGKDSPIIEDVLKEVSEENGIACYELGVCEKKPGLNNRVELDTSNGKFEYDVINFE